MKRNDPNIICINAMIPERDIDCAADLQIYADTIGQIIDNIIDTMSEKNKRAALKLAHAVSEEMHDRLLKRIWED